MFSEIFHQSLQTLAHLLEHRWHLSHGQVSVWEQLTPLNADQGLRAGDPMQGTALCTPEMNQGESQLLWVWVAWGTEFCFSGDLAAGGEMAASRLLNQCSEQEKRADPSFLLCVLSFWMCRGEHLHLTQTDTRC